MFVPVKRLVLLAITALLFVAAATPAEAQINPSVLSFRVQEFVLGVARGQLSTDEAYDRLQSFTTEERLEFTKAAAQQVTDLEARIQGLEKDQEGYFWIDVRWKAMIMVSAIRPAMYVVLYTTIPKYVPPKDRVSKIIAVTSLISATFAIYKMARHEEVARITEEEKQMLMVEASRTKQFLNAVATALENKVKIGE